MSFPFTADDVMAAYARHPEIKPARTFYRRDDDRELCCPAGIMALDKDRDTYLNTWTGQGYVGTAASILGLTYDQIDGLARGFDLCKAREYDNGEALEAVNVGTECYSRLHAEGRI